MRACGDVCVHSQPQFAWSELKCCMLNSPFTRSSVHDMPLADVQLLAAQMAATSGVCERPSPTKPARL